MRMEGVRLYAQSQIVHIFISSASLSPCVSAPTDGYWFLIILQTLCVRFLNAHSRARHVRDMKQ